MSNMDLLRELVRQRLSEAADEVFDLFLKSIDEYKEQIRSQNRILMQTPDIELDSAKSRESLEQQSCSSSVDLPISFSKQIKQEPTEPIELWNHVEDLQHVKAEAFSCPTHQINNTVKETGVCERPESQVQPGCNPPVDCKFPLPLPIKEEPEEPKEPWKDQEDQQLQEVEASSTVQIKKNHMEDQIPNLMKALLDGSHRNHSEKQQWSSSMTQEHNRTDESTKSPLPVVKKEEANSSLPLQKERDNVSYEEPMEMENAGEDDGGGSEAAQLTASDKTANSSDGETEDSEDEWNKPKQTLSKTVKIVKPEPVLEKINDEKKEINSKPPEIKTDVKSEPAPISAPPRDPVSEDMTSDSSDSESENSNHQRKMFAAKTNQHHEAAASSKSDSEKKNRQKSSKKSQGKPRLPCPQCGKEFIYKSNLYRHLRNHSGLNITKNKKKNVVCSVCGKRFTEQIYLDIHMRMHNKTTDGMKTCNQDKVEDSGGAG